MRVQVVLVDPSAPPPTTVARMGKSAYCFLTFSSPGAASAALSMNGINFLGSHLKVWHALPLTRSLSLSISAAPPLTPLSSPSTAPRLHLQVMRPGSYKGPETLARTWQEVIGAPPLPTTRDNADPSSGGGGAGESEVSSATKSVREVFLGNYNPEIMPMDELLGEFTFTDRPLLLCCSATHTLTHSLTHSLPPSHHHQNHQNQTSSHE